MRSLFVGSGMDEPARHQRAGSEQDTLRGSPLATVCIQIIDLWRPDLGDRWARRDAPPCRPSAGRRRWS